MTQDKRGDTGKRPLRVPVAEWDQVMVAQAACGYMANMLFNLRLVAVQHPDDEIRAQAGALLAWLGERNPDVIALCAAVARHAASAANGDQAVPGSPADAEGRGDDA